MNIGLYRIMNIKKWLSHAREILFGAGIILGMMHLIVPALLCAEGTGLPNFIIILTDDQGYHDLGCFGSKTIKTPCIDQLAREGIKLTSFYSQPVCGPARTALLTGCYPQRVNKGGWNVSSEEVTLAEVLHQAGYKTGCIGKWDISGRRYKAGMVPNDQGFDYYFGTLGANDKGRVTLWQNRDSLKETGDMGALTGLYTAESLKFIKGSKDQPFFLYLAHSMPHVKIDASPDFKGKSKGGLYGDVIEEIDWSTGKIIEILRELNLQQNTVLLFMSDNGPWLSKGEMGGSAFPLRGGKGSAWEGGFRVPAIIWGPGYIPKGRVNHQLLTSLDILPTCAALAGTELPDDLLIDGRNQSPLFLGKSDKGSRETFYYYVRGNLHAVRKNNWKLALPARKKFFAYAKDEPEVKKPELYNLETDLSEKINLAVSHPDIVKELLDLAETARNELGDLDRIGKYSRKKDQD